MSNPTPVQTPVNTRKTRYAIVRLDVNAINRALTDIGLRLDHVEAIGQDPNLHGRRIVNLGRGSEADDAARQDQIALIGFTTDDLPEGVTHLYFTNERVDDRVAVLLASGTAIAISYNDAANTLTIGVNIKAGYGIDADGDGLKLKQQAHLTDASTSHGIADPADAPASADALRDDLVTNTIPSIESALNALGSKINTLLSKLELAEVLASS